MSIEQATPSPEKPIDHIEIIEQTQPVFDYLLDLPSLERHEQLSRLAWVVAEVGLWDELVESIGPDNARASLPDSERLNKDTYWVGQFAYGGDYSRAFAMADNLKSEKKRQNALFFITQIAATQGRSDIVDDFRQSNPEMDAEKSKELSRSVFKGLVEQGLWDAADVEAENPDFTPDVQEMREIANTAAEQAEFDRVIEWIVKIIDKAPDARQRGDPDEGDWLTRPVRAAAELAAINGNREFLDKLKLVEWPEDAKENWPHWVRWGIQSAVDNGLELTTGLELLTDFDDEPLELSGFESTQEAIDQIKARNWDRLVECGSQWGVRNLLWLRKLAKAEDREDIADQFDEAIMSVSKSHRKVVQNWKAQDTLLKQAEAGEWDPVIKTLAKAKIRAVDLVAKRFVGIAIQQLNFDAVSDIIAFESTPTYSPFEAVDLLVEEGYLAEAEQVASGWFEGPHASDKVRRQDADLLKRHALFSIAPAAIDRGDFTRGFAAMKSVYEQDRQDYYGTRVLGAAAVACLEARRGDGRKSEPRTGPSPMD